MKQRARAISFSKAVALLSIAAFLIAAQGSLTNALGAEWQLWPKGRGNDAPAATPVPPAKPATPEAEAAAKAGEEGGKTVAAGATTGTIGKAALIAAGVLGIALAVGGGGGGGTTTTSHH